MTRGSWAAALALLFCCLIRYGHARVLQQTQTPLQKVLSRYMNNTELRAHMADYAVRCKRIANLTTIGTSVKGVPLQVLEISDRPGVEEVEPHFQYIANMHGTEPGGRQLLLALAEWLCANYATNATAQRLVNGVHLWLMPTMNPDGYQAQTYENARGINLNRDFPDPQLTKNLSPTGKEQPETAAVMRWLLSRQFTASANMHEGAFVANYPYDGTKSGASVYSASPDDGTFRFLANTYASRNPQLRTSGEFPGPPPGITNGAAWYSIWGGMQDWAYMKTGCFEITLELWDVKGQANLQVLWNNNRDAMLAYALTSTLGGLRGTVKRRGSLAPLEASITVSGSTTVTRSNKQFGTFFRPLAPGTYTVRVALSAAVFQTFNVTVPANGAGVARNVLFA